MSRLISRYETQIAPQLPHANILTDRGGLASEGAVPPAETKETSPAAESPGAKVYLDLLLKMIPGEVVTLYTFTIKLVPLIGVPQATGAAAGPVDPSKGVTGVQLGATWGLFVLAMVLTPVALSLQDPKPADPRWVWTWRFRLCLAIGAFPFWAYATTGEHLYPVPYIPALSLILVAVYAVVAGLLAKKVAPK
ncbi:MAG TPA: hypothetical protein VN578_12410 [Candidatus Binatia bacterium]|jgi:hypothetical protein|nr:hypothetical protein [Candidatus Binatia bacterium]